MIIKLNFINIFIILLTTNLIVILTVAQKQCESTDYQNESGFCTSDQFCCKGFAVNNLCPNGEVCCYGSYDCSSLSNPPVQQTVPCFTIISRKRWRARTPTQMIASIAPVEHIFIHHTDDGNTCFSDDSCGLRIRSLQSYHQLNKGWSDIAWNFIIGGNGQVYEGLGWNKEGFHTLNWNHNSLGIALIGNYNNEYPTNEMINSLESLIACGLKNGFIRNNYRIHGHRDVRRTACPGENVYRYLSRLKHFQSGPL